MEVLVRLKLMLSKPDDIASELRAMSAVSELNLAETVNSKLGSHFISKVKTQDTKISEIN